MSLFRTQLLAALSANTTIAAIVSARVFPSVVPETQKGAALVYSLPSVGREHNLDGPNGISNARVHYVVLSSKISECDAVKEELRNLFDGSSAALGTIAILSVKSLDEKDGYDVPADASEIGTFRQEFDLVYRFREPKPTLS